MLRGGDQVMCMFYMMCNTGGGTLVVVVVGGQVSKQGKHRFHYDNCEKFELNHKKFY